MGYRLYAQIPNIKGYNRRIELGKQYDGVWDEFNYYWFGENTDCGLILHSDLEEFLNHLLETNEEAEEHKLYNLDQLKEMIEHATVNMLDMYFDSF